MKILPQFAIGFISIFLLGQNCSADLILDITGAFGTGTTTWTFSGTDEAGAPEQFNFDFNTGIFGDPPLDDSIFAEQGDIFAAGFGTRFITPASTVTVTTPDGTRGIDELYLKDIGNIDDIGFAVTGNTDLQFAAGDNVSWTGEFELNIGLEELNIGSYSNNYFAFIFFTLDLTVNVSETTAIPEPSSVCFIGLMCIGLAGRRRRI